MLFCVLCFVGLGFTWVLINLHFPDLHKESKIIRNPKKVRYIGPGRVKGFIGGCLYQGNEFVKGAIMEFSGGS